MIDWENLTEPPFTKYLSKEVLKKTTEFCKSAKELPRKIYVMVKGHSGASKYCIVELEIFTFHNPCIPCKHIFIDVHISNH